MGFFIPEVSSGATTKMYKLMLEEDLKRPIIRLSLTTRKGITPPSSQAVLGDVLIDQCGSCP
jgi:hypothetical protein